MPSSRGVDTAEQFGRLRGLGCDLVQGPFVSQPLESHEILEARRRRLTAAGRGLLEEMQLSRTYPPSG